MKLSEARDLVAERVQASAGAREHGRGYVLEAGTIEDINRKLLSDLLPTHELDELIGELPQIALGTLEATVGNGKTAPLESAFAQMFAIGVFVGRSGD